MKGLVYVFGATLLSGCVVSEKVEYRSPYGAYEERDFWGKTRVETRIIGSEDKPVILKKGKPAYRPEDLEYNQR